MDFKRKINEAFDVLDWSMAFLSAHKEERQDDFLDELRKHLKNNPEDTIELIFDIDDIRSLPNPKYALRHLKALKERFGSGSKITIKGHDRHNDVALEPNVFSSGINYVELVKSSF